MIQISGIEIWYFRSLHHVKIKNLTDVSTFAGKNDSGKSNILRALNLFFNGQTGFGETFNFNRDFARTRLNECRSTNKKKQYIKIKISFLRGNRYNGLPKNFDVTRTWDRNSQQYKESNSLESKKSSLLSRYINTIQFEYIPAIKERAYFNYLLSRLQDTLLHSKKDEILQQLLANLITLLKVMLNHLPQSFKQLLVFPPKLNYHKLGRIYSKHFL